MTNHPFKPTITLPLFSAYIEALLASLIKADNTETLVTTYLSTRSNSDSHDKVNNNVNYDPSKAATLLWAVSDQSAALLMSEHLKSHFYTDVAISSDNTTSSAHKLMASSQIITLAELNNHTSKQRYPLACFWLTELSKEQWQPYIPLLMRYRDLYAAHLLIALDNSIDLRAYGFTPFNIFEEMPLQSEIDICSNTSIIEPEITLWQFNLYDYKPLPNWFNADHWANPENWDKRRW